MSYLGSTKQDKVVYIPVQDYKNIYIYAVQYITPIVL